MGGLARHEQTLLRLRKLDAEVALPGHGPPIVGQGQVRRRIDETVATIRWQRTHPQRWASTVLKSFLVMHLAASETVSRGAFVERCARSAWFREQSQRFFPGSGAGLVSELVDELSALKVLRAEGDLLMCALKA
jgi:hypothetical protein